MGTRSLTIIQDEKGNEIAVMYRQFDGYPAGHGSELAEFLSGMMIVNGMGAGQPERIANGMNCLAAQIIAHFKEEPGGIYLYPALTRDCWEEYIYIVSGKEGGEPHLELFDMDWDDQTHKLVVQSKPIFDGPASEYAEWLTKYTESKEQ